jgi:hypothetical protein
MSPARAIAEDHCDWAADAGLSPREVCLSVLSAFAPVPVDVTWEDAMLHVMSAWTEIAKRDRRAAA